jgi:hypothetical protein
MKFQETYNEMFIKEEQCRSCDLQGFCYQCPAGNSDSGRGQLFRPDNMCQQIVRLFLDLQNDIVKKTFHTKLQQLMQTVQEKGEEYTVAKAIVYLTYYQITGVHLDTNEFDDFVLQIPSSGALMANMWSLMENNITIMPPLTRYLNTMSTYSGTELNIKQLYENILQSKGKSVAASKADGGIDDVNKRTFYLALLHLVILNKKGEDVTKPHKIIKL